MFAAGRYGNTGSLQFMARTATILLVEDDANDALLVRKAAQKTLAGIPIVVLEPSCAAVFRDELIGLLPDDEDAKRLSAQKSYLSLR